MVKNKSLGIFILFIFFLLLASNGGGGFIVFCILIYYFFEKIFDKKASILVSNINQVEVDKKEVYPYQKQKSLFYFSEKRFYFVLKDVLKGDYVIFPKVRMCDLLFIPSMDNSSYYSYFGKIKSKHIDFVICDIESFEPLLAIELDGNSHYRYDRVERDNFVNNIFADAKFPLLHFSASFNYSDEEVSRQLFLYLTKKNRGV